MKEKLKEGIELPESVSAQQQGSSITIQGKKSSVARIFIHPGIQLQVEKQRITLTAPLATKREKKQLHTFVAHLKNMIKGVQEPHHYTLKICSGHFPMNVSISGREFVVKNFLGESVPRKVTLPEGVEVKITGTEIDVRSPDKEAAGLAAARMERLCRITNRDIRVFQDGCYILQKAGKAVV